MASSHRAVTQRVTVDGKFFLAGPERFYVKGVTYGPFAPDAAGLTFGTPEQARRDFARVLELGANTLRVYYVPPRSFLDLAAEYGLRVFIDIPWAKHLCFLDEAELMNQARIAVREAVSACAGHPAVLAFSVVNEISPEVARWSGPARVERFVEELIDVAKAADPQALCTFAAYPSSEFLRPRNVDFLCFNVYLHHRPSFEGYLSRLQTLADTRPLLLGEVGMDSWREGEEAKCHFLSWQIEAAFRGGLAGTILFSFTDDWFRGGHQIEDWSFGLTTRTREPKPSFHAVAAAYQMAPRFPMPRVPKVSVVVASYNGGKTLKVCLDSLGRLNYPDYEVILVDDGSTDNTPEITARFPDVRVVRQANLGLSAARNAGITAAQGEIVAFTDSDCRADENWLYYIVDDLLHSDFAGMGGPNFLPPDDSPTAAVVMASPGGPAQVMLTDREAEHIPGCNMVFYRSVLEQIGGFDPVFRKAGDDVDICWRLQTEGYRLGFSPGGFVWHYRRSTVKAYLRQQAGYGEAEALLIRKHPEFFSALGGSIWRGRIYSPSCLGVVTQRPVIYHGLFGSGAFQRLYAAQPMTAFALLNSLPWHLMVTLPLVLLSLHFAVFVPLAVVAFGASLGVCLATAAQAEVAVRQRRWWSHSLVAVLCFLQPIARGWARYRFSIGGEEIAKSNEMGWESVPLNEVPPGQPIALWAEQKGFDRYEFLAGLLASLKERRLQAHMATEWSRHDLEVANGPWARLILATVTEDHAEGRKVLRCRLRTAWTLRSILAFGLALGLVLLVTGVFARQTEWIWMAPLALPLVYLYFENEARRLERRVAATVIANGRRRGLKLMVASRTGPGSEDAAAVRPTSPVTSPIQ